MEKEVLCMRRYPQKEELILRRNNQMRSSRSKGAKWILSKRQRFRMSRAFVQFATLSCLLWVSARWLPRAAAVEATMIAEDMTGYSVSDNDMGSNDNRYPSTSDVVEGNTTVTFVEEPPLTTTVNSQSPTPAVLFPWFVEIVGVVVFFLLTRFELPVPYAAVMFLLGIFMGWGAQSASEHLEATERSTTSTSSFFIDQLATGLGIRQWSNINSDVLMLVFLPGLIFRDAIEVQFNLFMKALPQILILAFPMVLVGTALTAMVGFYVMPYSWPLSLAAILGSVLSSTDPVAVGSVLKSVGAPPRLQMMVSGESLLNDGSAVVFFTIFARQYLAELGEGTPVDITTGVVTFLRMALGGTAVGLVFSVALLLVLFELDRRLEPEYNVLQVVAALTIAYLSYYVSEQICMMSGVISCVVCGITARALGRGLITDNRLMDSYLALMEHLLNTLLFTIGGVVYGTVISGSTRRFGWRDWAYLGLLYVLIMVIRLLQVTLFYPVLSKVGLKTNWAETLFLAFGGLRGAVGIALALSLNGLSRDLFADQPEVLSSTREMEFMAGGVTFLTLFLNGTAAGPVLKWLGLAKPTMSRKRALRLFKASAESFVNDEFVKLIQQKRFMCTDELVIKHLVPFLSLDLREHHESMLLVSRITDDDDEDGATRSSSSSEDERNNNLVLSTDADRMIRLSTASRRQCHQEMLQEIRGLYLDLLNEAYEEEVSNNELDEREDNGLNFQVLHQSVAFAAADNNDHQEPLHDWQYTQNFRPVEDVVSFVTRQYYALTGRQFGGVNATLLGSRGGNDGPECTTYKMQEERTIVLRAISFIEAHKAAEHKLNAYVQSLMISSIDDDEAISLLVCSAIDTVLGESAQQIAEAKAELSKHSVERIDNIISNHVATILLRRLANFVERRANDGFLTKKEARLYLDKIDENIQRAHDAPLLAQENPQPHRCIIISNDDDSAILENFDLDDDNSFGEEHNLDDRDETAWIEEGTRRPKKEQATRSKEKQQGSAKPYRHKFYK